MLRRIHGVTLKERKGGDQRTVETNEFGYRER